MLILIEPIDINILNKLINSDLLKIVFHNPLCKGYENEKQYLLCYKKLVKKGKAEIIYNKAKNIKFGRVNPHKALGLFSITNMDLSLEAREKELTPSQKSKLKYYLKMKNDPNFKQKQYESSAKYYEKIKNDPNFKKQVSEQKKIYHKKIKDSQLDVYFPNL